MSAKIWKMIGTSTMNREITGFDLLDAGLRWVGYEIEIREVFWKEVSEISVWTRDEPTKFVAFTHNTRDSVHYGPSSEPLWSDDLAELTKRARKRRAGARRRQERNWSGLNEARRATS